MDDNNIKPIEAPAIQPLLAPDTNDSNGNDATVIIVPSQPQDQPSTQKSTVTKVKLSDELNIFDWFRASDILSQIAEKARHSVETVITAVDPGMKEYLYSGGNINVMVISDSENFISPIRDSFQTAFGRATVGPAKYNSPDLASEFPIRIARGFKEAIEVSREKIRALRLSTETVPQNQVIAVVQPTLVYLPYESNSINQNNEAFELVSPKCHLTYCMLIEDPILVTTISTFSQFIPMDEEVIVIADEFKVAEKYAHLQHLGYTKPIDDVMNAKLKISPREFGNLDDCQWLKVWAGLSESQIIKDLSSSMAYNYRRRWDECIN